MSLQRLSELEKKSKSNEIDQKTEMKDKTFV